MRLVISAAVCVLVLFSYAGEITSTLYAEFASLSFTFHTRPTDFLMFLIVAAYDPLDPNGNVTIKWDVVSWTPDGYVVSNTN